jgi:L-ascorbate metabolism protein UlaG (beta-lactamase superfamily)
MKITYLGHACFQVEIKGKYLLFDPFITGNELAKAIDINTIKAMPTTLPTAKASPNAPTPKLFAPGKSTNGSTTRAS